jgi:hypothetical protein
MFPRRQDKFVERIPGWSRYLDLMKTPKWSPPTPRNITWNVEMRMLVRMYNESARRVCGLERAALTRWEGEEEGVGTAVGSKIGFKDLC